MPTHAERRILPHTPQQLYDLVADVERYPQFLPWAIACRIRKNVGPVIWADLVIGFKMIRERFTSKVTLNPEALRIDVEYVDGPFHYLNNHWQFEAHPEGCTVDFFVDFEFKNKVLQTIIGALFNEAVKRMVAAFETRAKQLYG